MNAAGPPPNLAPNTTIEQEVIIQLLTRGVLLLVTLLTHSLLAYLLLTEGRGAYAICIVLGIMLGVLFTPGADRGAQYSLLVGQNTLSQSVSIVFAICLAGSAVAVLLTWPLIHSDLTFFQQADRSSFYLAMLLVPLSALSVSLERQAAALRRFARIAFIVPTRGLVVMLGILLLTWQLGWGVEGALTAVALGYVTQIALFLVDLRRHCGLGWQLPTWAGFRHTLYYGLRFHIARAVVAFDPRIGALLLGIVATRGEIGLFTAASGIMFRIATIPNALGASLLPRIAGDATGQPELMALYLRLVSLVTGAVLLALLLVSQPAIRLLLSENFLPVVPLVWIMTPGIFAFTAGKIFEIYFSGVNRPQVCSWALWIGLIANIAAFFILYPPYGLTGAAYAFSIGMLLRGVFMAAVFHRSSGLPLLQTWLLRRGDVVFLWAELRRALRRRKESRRDLGAAD